MREEYVSPLSVATNPMTFSPRKTAMLPEGVAVSTARISTISIIRVLPQLPDQTSGNRYSSLKFLTLEKYWICLTQAPPVPKISTGVRGGIFHLWTLSLAKRLYIQIMESV